MLVKRLTMMTLLMLQQPNHREHMENDNCKTSNYEK